MPRLSALTAVVASLVASRASAKEEYCAPDLNPPDPRTASSAAWLKAQEDGINKGPSHSADSAEYQASCERYITTHFARSTACLSDDDCGGKDSGVCTSGLCRCAPGFAGTACGIDAQAICHQEDYWTAFGDDSGAPCAGTATRTACSPSKGAKTCSGSEWCAVTDNTCICGVGRCWDAVARECKDNDATIKAKAWSRPPRAEWDDARLMSRTENFGIALSGGGTRAMVSGIGVLQGLDKIGVLGRARYLAGNSGGSWAASIYTYAHSSISDAQLLGMYVPPERLTNGSVLHLDPANAAAAARNPFGAILLTMANDAPVRYRDMWALAVAKAFFEPYGFGKLMSYYAYDEKSVAEIRRRNPPLAGAHFDTVRSNRPYLLMSGVMLGPRAQAVGSGGITWSEQSYQGFVFSPLFVGPVTAIGGTPLMRSGPTEDYYQQNVSFYCESKNYGCLEASTFDVAGPTTRGRRGRGDKDRSVVTVAGAVEPFAFGAGAAPRGLTAEDGSVADEEVLSMALPMSPFSLALASGISSAAAAAALSAQPYGLPGKYCRLAHIAPVVEYMSPLPAAPQSTPMAFGDGGSLDNFGIWGLLARGTEKVILVVSTSTPLDVKLCAAVAGVMRARGLSWHLPAAVSRSPPPVASPTSPRVTRWTCRCSTSSVRGPTSPTPTCSSPASSRCDASSRERTCVPGSPVLSQSPRSASIERPSLPSSASFFLRVCPGPPS